MSIKTEIINNLVNEIKTNIPEFRKVERGLKALEDKHITFPLCVINSIRTIKNDLQSTYSRLVKTMFVYVDILEQSKSDYFSKLDDYETKMISLIDSLDYDKRLHNNVINLEIEEVEEIINDEYLDGLGHLRVTVKINYFEN